MSVASVFFDVDVQGVNPDVRMRVCVSVTEAGEAAGSAAARPRFLTAEGGIL